MDGETLVEIAVGGIAVGVGLMFGAVAIGWVRRVVGRSLGDDDPRRPERDDPRP